MKLLYLLLATTVLCPTLRPASGQQNRVSATASHGKTIDWDAAFHDESGITPLHLTAHYTDSHNQTHRLEEWRIGQAHLRRKTDDHIDLHADAANAREPYDYVWQILDLQKHIAHRISTAGMLHLGMLYSYYSMAHLLTRPAGRFTISASTAPVGSDAGTPLSGHTPHPPTPCSWFQVETPGQPATRICWTPRYGIAAQLWSQTPLGWRCTFQVDTLDTRPIPTAVFHVDTTGYQVRDVDALEAED